MDFATGTNLTAEKIRKPKPVKPSSSVPPLGKFLASSEKHVRDKAVASLSRFLAGTKVGASDDEPLEIGSITDADWAEEWTPDARLAPLEMDKLWKGIWFCFWMSDKPLIQQALANDLALLTLDVRARAGKGRATGRVARFRAAMTYLRGFWAAVVREWSGLDRLRLEKFYMLLRRFIHVGFLLLRREGWDPRAIKEYNEMLTGPGGPLHVTDSRIPHSIAYHLADIAVAELSRSLASPLTTLPPLATPLPAQSTPLVALLAPYLTTLACSQSKAMWTRFSEEVFDPLLDSSLPVVAPPAKKRRTEAKDKVDPEACVVLEDAVESQGVEDVEERRKRAGVEVLKALFVEGGKETTDEVNRRRLYQFVKAREDASGVDVDV